MKEKRYPVVSEKRSSAAPVERSLSDAELPEEIARAEKIEDAGWRKEWLGRLRAEVERREAL